VTRPLRRDLEAVGTGERDDLGDVALVVGQRDQGGALDERQVVGLCASAQPGSPGAIAAPDRRFRKSRSPPSISTTVIAASLVSTAF
jgi:hypothetical protein